MLELRGPNPTSKSPADKLLDPIVGFGVGQPVYIPSQPGKRGLQPFIRRRVASRLSAPRSFCLVRRSDNGEIPLVRQPGDCTMPACLPVVLWLTTAGQRVFLCLDERKRTFTNLATRKWLVIEENGTTWIEIM